MRESSRNKIRSNKQLNEPLFSTTVPSQPRRQLPSVRYDKYFEEETPITTFRHSDSTSRALASIAQSKYDKMERRRACALLLLLIIFAATIHVVSSRSFYTSDTLKESSTSLRYKGKMQDLSAATVNAIQDEDITKLEMDVKPKTEETSDPDFLDGVRNFRDFNEDREDNDITFYWHVPRSAGSTMKAIMGECFSLVSACEVGVRDGHANDPELDVIEIDGSKYINVDTSSIDGIDRASLLNLVTSTITRPDVIVSSYLNPVSEKLYDEDHQGRAFVLLRHPIERVTSMYYYSLETGSIADVSMEDYAKGAGIENNWLTRYLTGQLEGELPREALEKAKTILKKKFLIGFVDDLTESLQRFVKYNNWLDTSDELASNQQEQCMDVLAEAGVNRNMKDYEIPRKGSQAYSLIAWQTQYDLKLYEYAKELFDAQTKAWGTKERKKADKKKKKAAGG